MLIKQLSVFVENRRGRLAEITTVLAENLVDIRAMSIADTTDFGILRLIVDATDKAEAVLKEAGYTASKTNVLAIGIVDTPGSLAGVMCLLRDNDISVEYMYSFLSQTAGHASVILRTSDPEKATELFEKNGVQLLTEEDIFNS